MSQTPTKEVRESKDVLVTLIFKLQLYLEICENPWKNHGILSLRKNGNPGYDIHLGIKLLFVALKVDFDVFTVIQRNSKYRCKGAQSRNGPVCTPDCSYSG